MATANYITKEDLKAELECPICLIIPRRGPIYQCVNGHIICKECQEKVDTCPVCRDDMFEIRNLVVEKILQK